MEYESTVESSSPRKVNVLAIVDTGISRFLPPSLDLSTPATVSPDCLFMIGPRMQSDAGDVRVRARVGDLLSLTGTSIDLNSNSAVILYGVGSATGERVLSRFRPRFATRTHAVQANPDSANHDGLPALHVNASFQSLESKILAYGTEHILFDFALYTLSESGQKHVLFSYCRCGVAITVDE
ncbi:AidA/PixA family protein [Paraburkholderia sp. SARCC-3016]|uniref:AidA/PixA family protein n=1 Tax=Paraburkholderia sp. SARCC-3016 TaxID=3058611 RepID=UPI0028094014|nr:AidA/PixA family protein [Paraburkholderia sp. SARCC-3016]MDQ7981742.1 AidA/PixA family protein [Paraburkholderia sp. SARCC-3016]